MQVSATTALPPMSSIDTASLGVPSNRNAADVAESFESVFASMLVKELRNTLSEGFFGSESSDVFGGLFDLHMGQAMTEGRGLGIKQLVLSQWQSKSP
jgi:Rod binding domain-containing protein